MTYKEALEKIAPILGKTPEELERELDREISKESLFSPDCLDPIDYERENLIRGLPKESEEHLQRCDMCRTLVTEAKKKFGLK